MKLKNIITKIPRSLKKLSTRIIVTIMKWYIDESPLLSKETTQYSELKTKMSMIVKARKTYIADATYRLITKKNLIKILNKSLIKYIPYTTEKFDCDDYAKILNGMMGLICPNICFGIAWSPTHAFNICMLDDHKIYIVEPQQNLIISLKESKKLKQYNKIDVVMI